MLTFFGSPLHTIPCESRAPTLKDELGGGAMELRRQWTRPLRRWEITIPASHERLDPILGLLDFIQGDTPIWFDGAGFAEVIEAIPVGIGDGSTTDFRLPHRHVFVSSLVVYLNGAVFSAWSPLGSPMIADTIRFTAAPAAYTQITAKYKRKIKVVLETESNVVQTRIIRNADAPERSYYQLHYFLQEVAT